MPLFATTYPLAGSVASTQCYARDFEDLDRVMGLRGMGEKLWRPYYSHETSDFYQPERPKLASELLRTGRPAAANHALVWASMIATKAGKADGWELLNDYGLVHELAHVMHAIEEQGPTSARGDDLKRLAGKVERFERSIPGLHPCWGEQLVVSDHPHETLVFCVGEQRVPVEITVAVDALRALNEQLDNFEFKVHPRRREYFEASRRQGKAARQAMVANALPKLKPVVFGIDLGADDPVSTLTAVLRKSGFFERVVKSSVAAGLDVKTLRFPVAEALVNAEPLPEGAPSPFRFVEVAV